MTHPSSMEPSLVRYAVIHHMANNSSEYQGIMPFSHFFVARGPKEQIGKNGPEGEVLGVCQGFLPDVIAELVESGNYFMNGSNGNPKNEAEIYAAMRSVRNGQVHPIRLGQPFTIVPDLKLEKKDPYPAVLEIDERPYLQDLSFRRGFFEAAGKVGVPGDLERIARDLYSRQDKKVQSNIG